MVVLPLTVIGGSGSKAKEWWQGLDRHRSMANKSLRIDLEVTGVDEANAGTMHI